MAYDLKKYFQEAKVPEKQIPDWFESITLAHPSVKDFRPRWHQVTGLNLTMAYSRSALFDEQGTGKTLPAQAVLAWHSAVGNRPVALMPPILIDQFIESFYETFVGIEQRLSVVAYRGTISKRNALLKSFREEGEKFPIIVMTPEIFRAEFAAFKELGCVALVCDECKYWANPDTKTYRAIDNFLGKPGDSAIVGMNGTPAKNDLSDLYGYIKMLTPHVYKSRAQFFSQHVVMKSVPVRYNKDGELREREVEVIDSFKNIPKLRENLYLQARRVEKADVIEIPEKQIITFPFHLSEAHASAYQEFCFARFLEFKDGTALSGEQTATLRQVAAQSVVDTSILRVSEKSAVLDAVDQLLEQIDVSGTKVTIAAYYNKTIETLAEHLKKYNPAVIYGPNGSKNLKAADRFKKDPTCRLAILNYQSGGVGLNFQDVCHYGISAEPTTIPGDFDQWTDRMHRSGQKQKTTIYVLQPRGTIWVHMIDSMLKKKAWNKQVVSVAALKAELSGGQG